MDTSRTILSFARAGPLYTRQASTLTAALLPLKRKEEGCEGNNKVEQRTSEMDKNRRNKKSMGMERRADRADEASDES